MYQDPGVRVHISGEALAEMLEEFFNIEDYNIVQPYIQISEQADAQRLQQAAQQQVMNEAQTPSGLNPADSTQPFAPQQGGGQGSAPTAFPRPVVPAFFNKKAGYGISH